MNYRDNLNFSRPITHAHSHEGVGTFSWTASGARTGILKESPLPTPPSSTRPSIEQPHITSSTSEQQYAGGSVDLTHQLERAVYTLATPPKSPPKCTEPPTLLSVIASVRDVLEGRESQRTIRNVSRELYEELDARAKLDMDLVGWEGTRYVSFGLP
jgi:hypothetical protein